MTLGELQEKASPAKEWRIRFVPRLEVLHGDQPHRFRTRQQMLLLTRLVVATEIPLDRAEASALLWPEAEPDRARTYLRRAVMELRQAGIEILSTEAGLSLTDVSISSDFEDAVASGSLGVNGEGLVTDSDSPMVDELRHLIATKSRRRSRRPGAPRADSPSDDADRFVLSLLGNALLDLHPKVAMEIVAANRYRFYTQAPEPDLLRFLHRLCEAAPDPTPDRIAVLCVMGGISSIETLYGAADDLYQKAIRDAELLGATALLARALAMRTGTLVELRSWVSAKEAAERSVLVAQESGDSVAMAFSLAALASYQWHVGLYDDSVQSYLRAIELAEPGAHQDNARHNLSFVWGVLGGKMAEPPPMQEPAVYGGTHMPGGQSYEMFSLGIGHGRYRDAARGAAAALTLAADGGMERLIAIGLDNAGIAFAKLGNASEAAACVRLGTRLRIALAHSRSPMEHDALRRHLTSGYFVPGTRDWEESWRSPDPAATAYRVAARLRLAAL